MQHPGWSVIVIGVLIVVIGLVWLFLPSIPWLGKFLPTRLVFVRPFGAGP